MGWNWSAGARAALNGGHTAVTRVDVWHSGQPVYTLAATGGSVTMDSSRAVRSNMLCDLTDPTGSLSRGDVDDLLTPYECEIAPYRGVRWKNAVGEYVDEYAPLGVFRLTGRDIDDSGDTLAITLAGQDRAMMYQGAMASGLGISGGTPVEEAIRQLLVTRNRGLSIVSMRTGFTVGPLIYEPDIDVWAVAQKLAESVGARLYHDRTGQVVLALAGPISDRPVAAYEQRGGLLVNVKRSEDSDTIKNVVVAENTDGSIRVRVEDTDPASPTYTRGRYGEHVHVLKNPHIASIAQATQAATIRLAYELGRSETVSFTAVPDPGLDVDEVVTVHRPRAGLTHRGLVTASVRIPLKVADGTRGIPMQVECRKSRLAQDGRVLPDLAPVAA